MYNGRKISDFARPEPNIYTAYMKIQPVRDEVLWLLGKEKFRDLSFNGASTLFLSGKGTDEDYHINARWDLADAAYAYPEVLEKPKARKTIRLLPKLLSIMMPLISRPFKYDLPPMNVTAAAMFRFSGEMPLSFNIQSKTFDIREAVPILPVLRTFNPAGNCSLAVAGRGDLSDPASIHWNGNISLANVSFQPLDNVKSSERFDGKGFFQREAQWKHRCLKQELERAIFRGISE